MSILLSESAALAIYMCSSIDASGGDLELANTQAWEYVGFRLLPWGVGVVRHVGPLCILQYLHDHSRCPHQFFCIQKGMYPLSTCTLWTYPLVDQVRHPFLPMGQYHLAGGERQSGLWFLHPSPRLCRS